MSCSLIVDVVKSIGQLNGGGAYPYFGIPVHQR